MTYSSSSSNCGSCETDNAYGLWLAIILVIALAVWFSMAIFEAIDHNIRKNALDNEDPDRLSANKWWHVLVVAIIGLLLAWGVSCWVGCGGCATSSKMY